MLDNVAIDAHKKRPVIIGGGSKYKFIKPMRITEHNERETSLVLIADMTFSSYSLLPKTLWSVSESSRSNVRNQRARSQTDSSKMEA